MKKRHLLFFLIAGVLVEEACKKEHSYEDGLKKLAVFTLDGAPGGCMGASVSGLYMTGAALDSANIVTINVNVISAGDYNFATTAVNGMTFTSAGSFTATGPQTIILKGSGTPVTAGNIDIPVSSGGTHCSFIINVNNAQSASVFTLDCASVVVNGFYKAGTSLVVANTVSMTVNVVTAGTYNITTTAINGMIFSASGVFNSAGVQSLTLQGSGAPLASGSFTVPVNTGSSSCNFQVTVNPASSSGAPNSWLFVENGITYQGIFTSTGLTTVPGVSETLLTATGQPSTADTLLTIKLSDVSGSIQVQDTYNTNSTAGNSASFSFRDVAAGNTIYRADNLTPGVNIQYKIISSDPLTKTIVGTFSGIALSGNAFKQIHNGVFYLTYP